MKARGRGPDKVVGTKADATRTRVTDSVERAKQNAGKVIKTSIAGNKFRERGPVVPFKGGETKNRLHATMDSPEDSDGMPTLDLGHESPRMRKLWLSSKQKDLRELNKVKRAVTAARNAREVRAKNKRKKGGS
jgi:hypothetical protein